MLRRIFCPALFFILAAGLSACGGSGSSGSSNTTGTATSPEYPIDNAVSVFMQMAHNYTLHETSDNNSYTLQLGFIPQGPETLHDIYGNETQAFVTERKLTVTEKGYSQYGPMIQEDELEFFTTDPYQRLASIVPDGSQGIIYDQNVDMPSEAVIGQSGDLDAGTTLTLENGVYQVTAPNITDTWTLKSGSGGDASLCLIKIMSGPAGGGEEIDTYCYTMDTRGNITGLAVTMDFGDSELVFK